MNVSLQLLRSILAGAELYMEENNLNNLDSKDVYISFDGHIFVQNTVWDKEELVGNHKSSVPPAHPLY
tara:strand:- start:64 stop:267 length:204 start_codon:yes stop_codon:yes gene_type:complete